MHYTLTIYESDDTTPLLEVGTDPTHPYPYLHVPGEMDLGEVDLLAGKAMIGQVNLRVIDPQTGADQSERWMTARLGVPQGQEGAGHSALNGRRARLMRSDGRLIMDGVLWGVQLSDTAAGFHLQLRDVRERARKLPLFQRTGTASVLPRGVIAGYGKLPNGEWLIPPTKPLRADVVGAGFAVSGITLDFQPHHWQRKDKTWWAVPDLALTDAIRTAVQPAVTHTVDHGFGAAPVARCPDVTVLWRYVGDTAWEEVRSPIPAGGEGRLLSVQTAKLPATAEAEAMIVEAIRGVRLSSILQGPLPDTGRVVEVIIRYDGPPSEMYPYHFEGSVGELIRNALRGDYSGGPTKIRYDEAEVLKLTTPVRVRLTQPVEDMRPWLEQAHQQLAAAPALDSQGRISPVLAALPPTDEPLPVITEANASAIPGWEHPADGAVTSVAVRYQRDYLVRAIDDPLGERSAGDGIASIDVTVEHAGPEWARELMGDHPLEIDGWLFRAIGGAEGDPVTGDVINEDGAQASRRLGYLFIDRFLFGGQTSFVRVAEADFPGLREGSWVIDERPWRPNYRTGQRGGSTLAQVVSIRAAVPGHLDLRLVDAGPLDQPLNVPAIGPLAATDQGGVSVPVTTVPVGAEVAVYYAISATEPAADSGLWTFAGRTDEVGTIETPPVPAGARVWAYARSEAPGRRPSGRTARRSITLASTPGVYGVRAGIDDDGEATVWWEGNPHTAGVRIYYAVYEVGDPEPTLTTYIDRDASALSTTLPIPVGATQILSVAVEPWTGWTGSAVSGTAGDRVPVSVASNRPPPVVIPEYAECQARVIASTASTITVQVDAVPAGATVYLYALTKATLQSGAELGVPVPAGSIWTFARPGFRAGEGQAVFRAESPGYHSDDDHVVISEVGRDTIGLLMRARVQSVTATQVVVRVAVADPVDPTRTGAITITPQIAGAGSVTPSTAQTIAASAVRSDIDATGYIDFTLSRGAAGSGGGRVVFTATRADRVADADAVDVPEMPPTVVRYAECQARIVRSLSDDEHYVVEVSADPPTGDIWLLSLQGATIVSGPGLGVPVPASAPASSRRWKLKRPAARSADGEAVWRTDPPGYVQDDDAVVIPAIGRDTVPLTMRVRQLSTTATTRTMRVSVGDPHYSESSDPITISYVQQGTGGVTPASGQQIPASAIRDTPAATEAQPNGYVDFVITRPPEGSGDGRVIFTATRPGRVQDSDPVDVAELPPEVPVEALPPTVRAVVESLTGVSAEIRVTGSDWQGGTSGLQWSWRWHTLGDPLPAWGSWQSLPAAGALQQLARHAGRDRQAYFRVMDSAGRISSDAVVRVPAQYQAIDPDTGRIDRGTPTSDGRLLEDQDSSQLRADQAEAGAINEMHDRGLKPDGFDGNVGTGASARPAVQVVDGVDRSLGGLTTAGRLKSGVEPDADIAGLSAGAAAAQVQEPSQNLLPPGAGAPVDVPTGATRYPGATAATRDIPLAQMGLRMGDVVSYSARGRRVGADGVARIGIGWVDSEGEVMYYDTVDRSATTEGWMVVPAVTVPAGAVAARPFYGHRDGASGTASFRDAMLNRGPIALPFEEPPGRPGREGIDIWRGALNPQVTRSDGARLLAITAGMAVYEATNDSGPIVFDQPYQDTPIVVVMGPMAFSSSLGTGADQWRREFADQVTGAQIGNVIMEMESMSGESFKTQNFPAATLSSQNDARDLGGSGLTAQAGNGRYLAHYEVEMSCTAPPDFGIIEVSIVVSVDTRQGGGTFIERATKPYAISAQAGNTNTMQALNESLEAIVTSLDVGDQIRVRLKSVVVDERFGSGGSYSIAVRPKRVTYTAYVASRRSQTPPGSGRTGTVIVFGAT